MEIFFRSLNYFVRLGLAWLWFLISFFISCLLLPFAWKNPNLSFVAGKILYIGASRLLRFQLVILNHERIDLNTPCIFIANHQSNLDVFTMSTLYQKNTVLIGKKELLWVPIFGIFFYGSGHILLNRQSKTQSVADLQWLAKEVVRRKINVWVFPEGHRNKGSAQMLDFKKGAFRLAIESQVPIIPIVHQHLSRYFDRAEKKIGGQKIYAQVLEPVPTKGMTVKDCDSLMRSVRQKMEEGLAEINAMPIEKIY